MRDVRRLVSEYECKLNKRLIEEGYRGFVTSHFEAVNFLVESRTPTEVANYLCKKKSSVTDILKTLVKGGYVEIVSQDIDRRYKLITLTEKGEKLRERFEVIEKETTSEFWEKVSGNGMVSDAIEFLNSVT